jgi:hypothetical protein
VRVFRLIALACLLAPPAAAEVYRWTDAQGGVHYSSDLDDVPESQREAARANAGGTGRGAVMRIPGRPATPPAAPAAQPPATPVGQPEPPAPEGGAAEVIGGRNEAGWRGAAQQYRDAIERLEQQAGECTAGTFRHSAGAGGRAEREETAADACGRIQRELQANRRWLESLEEDAHRAGVPPGWLRE